MVFPFLESAFKKVIWIAVFSSNLKELFLQPISPLSRIRRVFQHFYELF